MALTANVKGIEIEFSGNVTKLSKALQQINKESGGVEKQLRDVKKALKFNPGNTRLIAQEQQLLKERIAKTKKELEAFKSAQRSLDDQGVSHTSHEYMEVERNIVECESKLKNFNKELRKANGAQLTTLGNKFKDLGGKIKSAGTSLTTFVTLPIAGFLAAGVKGASDLYEAQNKVDEVFGRSSGNIKKFSNTTLTSFGISKKAALDATATFGNMFQSTGIAKDKAVKMSKALTGLAGDMASFNNVPVDRALEALKAGIAGQPKALRSLGVTMTDSTLQEYAFAHGIDKSVSSMTEAEKQQLRYQFIMDKTKTQQGDFARTAGGAANASRVFQTNVKALATSFGVLLLPTVNKVLAFLNRLMTKFNTMPESTRKIIAIILLVIAAIGPLLTIIGSLMGAIGTIMIVMGTGLVTAALPVIGIIAAIVAGIIALIVIVKAAPKAWQELKASFKDWVVSMQADWNAFKGFFVDGWNSLKTSVMATWNSLKQEVISTFSSMGTAIQNRAQTIYSGAQSTFNRVKEAISAPFNKAAELVRSAMNRIRSIVNGTHLQLPSIKLPHFHVSGGTAPYGIGGKGSLPHFSVSWYKNGGILTKPTIFGAMGGRLLGAGEAGPEAVLPLSRLQEMLDQSNAGQNAMMSEMIALLQQLVMLMSANQRIDWNKREVGRLIREVSDAR